MKHDVKKSKWMLMKLAKLSSKLDKIESKQYLNWNNLNLKWNVCAVMKITMVNGYRTLNYVNNKSLNRCEKLAQNQSEHLSCLSGPRLSMSSGLKYLARITHKPEKLNGKSWNRIPSEPKQFRAGCARWLETVTS